MTKILLVEDDSALATGLRYLLENEGYELDIAGTVKDAKNYINDKEYNLFILDIGLPDGNGYDLCHHIRIDKQTPIIFLTARDDERDVVKGLEIGGDDYIAKPFRTKELVSRVKSVLRRFSTRITSNVLTSGDIKIDQLQARVYLREEEIFLTPSEYKLLLLYMNNSKKVIPRIAALENLWDVEGDFINDSSISVYIRRLREKIEDDPSNPHYLKTARGIGYIWDEEVRRS
ncbi:response regulator transcription factor [Microaceticoccus formicicus]|uniref:response regulator transcription factor n=1 Tax=Microaceticoccus formicicus TaxID=3118105 RepID=UPI003CD04A70|nr:response regulator transcription factor [Peptoniphilaceae bacterium AMB_02]